MKTRIFKIETYFKVKTRAQIIDDKADNLAKSIINDTEEFDHLEQVQIANLMLKKFKSLKGLHKQAAKSEADEKLDEVKRITEALKQLK
tara:strand:+ start:136 stop:402 length:267 start_codon:yes stop_codon:yes gene_type:complete